MPARTRLRALRPSPDEKSNTGACRGAEPDDFSVCNITRSRRTSWYYILRGDIVGIQVNADSCRTQKRILPSSVDPLTQKSLFLLLAQSQAILFQGRRHDVIIIIIVIINIIITLFTEEFFT